MVAELWVLEVRPVASRLVVELSLQAGERVVVEIAPV